MAEKIFIDGFLSNEVSANAPDFILGRGALHVERLSAWLAKNKGLANTGGYINYTIKQSKTTEKRYVEVDTYKKEDSAKATPSTGVKTGGYEGQIEYPKDPANPDDIPF